MLIDNRNLDYYKINYSAHDGSLSFDVQKNVKILSRLLREYDIATHGKKILDFGFGTGHILELFRRLGALCYGADISAEAVSRLAKNAEYELRLISGNQIPFEDDMFDIVVASQTIEHVPDESLILGEISRVLSPQGFFIMGVPSTVQGYNPLHFREYTKQDMKRLEQILKAHCLGYKVFGGKLFLKTYIYLNQIVTKGMGISGDRKSVV